MEAKFSQVREGTKESSVIMTIQEFESKLTEIAEAQKTGEEALKIDLADVEQ